jgi:hypothetical protein
MTCHGQIEGWTRLFKIFSAVNVNMKGRQKNSIIIHGYIKTDVKLSAQGTTYIITVNSFLFLITF